ncbi:MAG TPA: hypothetical protein O0X70_07445 [Methanocorpusculum sp.]|nr:hypothetical protein [Methanocorpusculum sp.]
MAEITASNLHGWLIDEQNAGSLGEIPATLYEEVYARASAIADAVRKLEDPFCEGAQSYMKERESLREYIRDIYAERMKKIMFLALASANGEEINREEVRKMVPGERRLYDVIVESAGACRKTLLDGKPTLETTAYDFVPQVRSDTASPLTEPEDEDLARACTDACADIEVADGDGTPGSGAEQAPEEYCVVAVHDTIQEFQDFSGRLYSLSPGDIVSMPAQTASILCKNNKALSISIRK